MPKMYCKYHVIIIYHSRGQAETPKNVDFVFKQSNIGEYLAGILLYMINAAI